jgi:nitrate/TMAO reductase-like tetraheme cytochrome c subunit
MGGTKALRRAVLAVVILGALIGGYAAATAYTSRPAFCKVCHEMTPYYDAWAAGPHAQTSCIKCHVDPGFIADAAHKLVALKEVYLHFTTKPTFPGKAVDLPDARCLSCHGGTIDPGIANFNHAEHRKQTSCKTCHRSAGHTVTADALKAAGVLNASAMPGTATGAAIVDGGVVLSGHKTVVCSDCHNMQVQACESCHDRPAGHQPGPCSNCHALGDSFAFNHPRVRGEHTYTSFSCDKCHPSGPPAVNCTCHGGVPPKDD